MKYVYLVQLPSRLSENGSALGDFDLGSEILGKSARKPDQFWNIMTIFG